MRFAIILTVLTFIMLLPGTVRADQIAVQALTETDFMVTVKAPGGAFIGHDMGGSRIMIRDKNTGDLVLEGITNGSPDGNAKLQFSLELASPLPVTISATGPLAQPQSHVTVSKDMILIPGKDYTADGGIMLELPGYAVDVLNPAAGTQTKFDPKTPITLMVNVIDMSGQRVEKKSSLSPDDIAVEARIYKDLTLIAATPLSFTGQPGLYSFNLKMPVAGQYRIIVTAYNPKTKEAGMDITGFTLVKP